MQISTLPDHCLVIAEAGVNHNGSLERALEMVAVAAEAGADAVKFQTFRADALAQPDAPKADYQRQTTAPEESQVEMLRRLELDEDAHLALMALCAQRGIQFLSTPFDLPSLHLLDRLGLEWLKIPSGEITHGPLLLAMAQTGKKLLLSTGMSTLEEVREALEILAFGMLHPMSASNLHIDRHAFRQAFASPQGRELLAQRVVLLHCTTEYPAPFDEVNLRAMATLADAFGLPVGFSDHTTGIAAALGAVALGARVVEKHFTLDRTLPGPDHRASLEPQELRALVQGIREVETALGGTEKAPTPSELKNRPIARKSLFAGRDMAAGELFSSENLRCTRPGDGISPMTWWEHLGRPATRPYRKGERITE